MAEPVSVRVFDELEAASRAAARRLGELATSSIARSGRFVLGLSGGRTPRRLYELLADRDELDWRRTHIVWADERCVPPGHEDSNYAMARACLLDHVPIPEDQVHRVRGELPPAEAARAYNELLMELLNAPAPGSGSGPDAVLLGIGSDGHTASLFPDGEGFDAQSWAVAARAPRGVTPRDRVTLTLAALNASRHAIFLVAGPGKDDAVAAALNAGDRAVPAGRVEAGTSTEWFLDRAASGLG